MFPLMIFLKLLTNKYSFVDSLINFEKIKKEKPRTLDLEKACDLYK